MPISEDVKSKPGVSFLFGYPLKRTYAPYLHNTLTRLAGVPRTYTRYETQDINDLITESKKDGFVGSAVTMPHKVAVCKLCDDLTDEGRAIGACNTVFWRYENGQKKLIGHNTDTIGIRDSFLLSDLPRLTEKESKPGMIVGGGGASRAAAYALAVFLNCSIIYVVNRDDSEVQAMVSDWEKSVLPIATKPKMVHVKTPEEANKLEGPVYIVSCVPDFPPSTEVEKAARATLTAFLEKPEKGQILEMCYNPRIWTDICQLSKDNGWTVIEGQIAMIWQGVAQQQLWLGCDLEDLPAKETFDLVQAQVKSDTETGAFPPQQ